MRLYLPPLYNSLQAKIRNTLQTSEHYSLTIDTNFTSPLFEVHSSSEFMQAHVTTIEEFGSGMISFKREVPASRPCKERNENLESNCYTSFSEVLRIEFPVQDK